MDEILNRIGIALIAWAVLTAFLNPWFENKFWRNVSLGCALTATVCLVVAP